ncbi:MAG: metallophosphoesterase [Candidatus Riflebacteria bacterium]|nr:metallophosphoesterase [Candidatus Riflebacteria bacterium]
MPSPLSTPSAHDAPAIAVVGDVHGHLQLALCVLARWQCELGFRFEAVFLCGDVGTFTDESQLDNATRRHGKANPCELEFLLQWSTRPQAAWLGAIFRRQEEAGLGLDCPVVMVHGNHEGFAHLARLVPASGPAGAVAPGELPAVDSEGHLRLLPSGWRTSTPSGLLVGGVGGIEPGQRHAEYHEMANLDEAAVLGLAEAGPVDLLVTHQGPAGTQGEEAGSESLQFLLDQEIAQVWFHGHSVARPGRQRAGPRGQTLVVPLGDVAFPGRGPEPDLPGTDGWAVAVLRPDGPSVLEESPGFLREFRRRLWPQTPDGLLVCPSLAQAVWGPRAGLLTESRSGLRCQRKQGPR